MNAHRIPRSHQHLARLAIQSPLLGLGRPSSSSSSRSISRSSSSSPPCSHHNHHHHHSRSPSPGAAGPLRRYATGALTKQHTSALQRARPRASPPPPQESYPAPSSAAASMPSSARGGADVVAAGITDAAGAAAPSRDGTAAAAPAPAPPSSGSRAFTSEATVGGDAGVAGGEGPAPIFSSNVSSHESALQRLGLLLSPNGAWSMSPSRKGIERTLHFRTFKATWAFMDAVAAECGRERHHPEWANVYNRVHVRWTTHRPEGLGEKDLSMAEVCDEKAREFGEERPSTAAGDGGGGASVVQGGEGDALQDLSEHIGKDSCDVCAR